MADSPQTAPPRARNVFAYPNFLKLLAASWFGALGDRFYQGLMMATANEIFQGESIRQKELGSVQYMRVQIFSILPMMILYAFVGSLVDACDRRRLLTWIEGVKVVLVLGFAWLLWNLPAMREIGGRGEIPAAWYGGIALVVLLNAITVPFSPARVSLVPDVLPEQRRSIGASLIATAGLCTYLVGGVVGLQLSRASALGPVKMAYISSGIFLISAAFFRWLPDSVTLPNIKRSGDGTGHATQKMSFGEYLAEQWDGLKYCGKHPSLLALILFETVFWTLAAMVLSFLDYYARQILQIQGGEITSFVSNGLGLAGVGIILGTLGAGKFQRALSPVFTYVIAILWICFSLSAFSTPAGVAIINGKTVAAASWVFYLRLLFLALGGGMMLGRVDADVLAIADERYRGRIFALKAVAFAVCTLATTVCLGEALTLAQKETIIGVLPTILLCCAPVVLLLSWLVDAAIWSKHTDIPAPNLRMRIQFKICSFITWCWIKVFFRYTVIGAENVPKTGPVILVANHGSFLDPIFLGSGCPRMVQYLMYTSYYTSIAHPIFRWLSAIPVDEKKHLQALKTGVASLEKGAVIGIFPEGQVAYERKLYPPQGGALFLAQKSGAPVVPVALKGNWDAMGRYMRFPRFKKVTAVFGKPFTVDKGSSKQETAELNRKMMVTIADMLGVPPPEAPSETPAKPAG